MIDDFGGPVNGGPRKPKRIEPIAQPPQKSVLDLAAEQGMDTDSAPIDATGTAKTQNAQDTPSPEYSLGASAITPRKNSFLRWRWSLSRKWTIVAAALAVLLIGGGGVFAYMQQPRGQGGVSVNKDTPKPPPKDTRVRNSLTGALVDASVNQRPVIGVMIENSLDARPQSGLDQAGVVFEAIAEGGITRFMALFQDTQPDHLGPVRSARPYYVQWCMSFDCAYAHAGGSPEALQNIQSWGTKDLNHAANYFWRISSRYAPHNLYSSVGKLTEYAASRGYNTPTFTGFARKDDQPYKAPAAGAPATDTRRAATTINLAISSHNYNARFDYDAATNSYARSQAGAAHTTVDAAGNQAQIRAKVVIAMITSYGIAPDGHSQYGVTGSGQAVVFQDGVATDATWHKPDTGSPLRFTDAAGNDIPLNAGQTWITALGGAGKLTY